MSDSGLIITIDCSHCDQRHTLPLDDSGHYSGYLPCDASLRAELQVDPQAWRDDMAAEHQRKVM